MEHDQLNALKQLRAYIDEQIEKIEEKEARTQEEKEEQFFLRVVELCSKFQNMWHFVPSSGEEDSWPAIRQYLPYDEDVLEIIDQADAEVRALVDLLRDQEADIRIWRHTYSSGYNHDANENLDIHGFTIFAPLDRLVEICRAAGLKNGALDHNNSYHRLRSQIAKLQEEVDNLQARADREETEWDNLYFGI